MRNRFTASYKRLAGLVRLALAALAALSMAAPAQAGEADDLWYFDYYWYEPEPLTSIDTAAGTIINLQKFFTLYGGMNIDQIVVTREGLAIHGSQTTVQQNSQYVPTYGGSWVGSTYVPYYGGSTVTTQVPVTSQQQAFISFKDVLRVELLYFPNLQNHWGVDFASREPGKTVTLRTSDEALARQFANAAVTLIEQANPAYIDNFDELGLWGVWDDAKAFKKAKYKGTGFYVLKATRGGPAERAGIRPGDIWISVNGQPRTKDQAFDAVVGPSYYNSKQFSFELEVWRDKQIVPLHFTARNVRVNRWLAKYPGMIGVSVRDLTSADPAVPGATPPAGVYVIAVTETALAERMDMRAGDILFEVNGTVVPNREGLKAIVKGLDIKSAKVLRDGAVVELREPPPPPVQPAAPQRLGLGVREVPAEDNHPGYVEVVSVEAGLAAAKLDFRVGDKLIEANGKPVQSSADLAAIIAAGPIETAKVERAGAVVVLGKVTVF